MAFFHGTTIKGGLKTLKQEIISTEARKHTRDLTGRRLWNRLRAHLQGGENLDMIASYRTQLDNLQGTVKERIARRNEILAERNKDPWWMKQEEEWKGINRRDSKKKKDIRRSDLPWEERDRQMNDAKEKYEQEQRAHPLFAEKEKEQQEKKKLMLERWENKDENEVSRSLWAGELSNKEKFEKVNEEFGKSYRWCGEKIRETYKDTDLGMNRYISAIRTLIGEWQEGKFSKPMRIDGQGDVILVTLEEYMNSLSKCERNVLDKTITDIQSFPEEKNARQSPTCTYAAAICVYPFVNPDGEKSMLYQGIHVHPVIFTARRMARKYALPSPTTLLFRKMKAWGVEHSITTMYVCPIGGMVQTATKNQTFEEVDNETAKKLSIGQWNIGSDFGCGWTTTYNESFADFARRIQ